MVWRAFSVLHRWRMETNFCEFSFHIHVACAQGTTTCIYYLLLRFGKFSCCKMESGVQNIRWYISGCGIYWAHAFDLQSCYWIFCLKLGTCYGLGLQPNLTGVCKCLKTHSHLWASMRINTIIHHFSGLFCTVSSAFVKLLIYDMLSNTCLCILHIFLYNI